MVWWCLLALLAADQLAFLRASSAVTGEAWKRFGFDLDRGTAFAVRHSPAWVVVPFTGWVYLLWVWRKFGRV